MTAANCFCVSICLYLISLALGVLAYTYDGSDIWAITPILVLMAAIVALIMAVDRHETESKR